VAANLAAPRDAASPRRDCGARRPRPWCRAAVHPLDGSTTAPAARRRALRVSTRAPAAHRVPSTARMRAPHAPATDQDLERLDAYWRAANYLSVGQIYLMDNPLLREPLRMEHVKPRLLGHWGTTPGLNLVYAHLNRVIRQRDLGMLYVCGPGHGGPGMVANTYLEGTYSELYPDVSEDAEGMRRLFRQFSFPGGIPSHAAPETPGSIHEGGELGYALMHAFGAAFDNPDLVVACVIGDGEAETGPLAASWHSHAFLDPAGDGAVLPILHLNGYKIANPTVLARMPAAQLDQLLRGYGWDPLVVAGDEPMAVHRQFADALDRALDRIADIQRRAREPGAGDAADAAPAWPMIVLRTPKGWTGPKEVDGKKTEGSWRSHQVPITPVRGDPGHLAALEAWLRSYRADELFDADGRLRPELAELAPRGDRRMGATPHANGGLLRRPLRLPDVRAHAVDVPAPGGTTGEATRVFGNYLRDVMRLNAGARNFRLFGPDETSSNRLDAVFEATDKVWREALDPDDAHLARTGRVVEVLSEHLCEGWLEGYLLTGRHGLFSCYEAFIHVVDSMMNQHAKWLKATREIPWRRPIASLNYLLTSHVWRQDHNGFSHQDPGFLDLVMNKKADVARVYLPPDANSLVWVADHCLRTYDRINVIVAGKQPAPQWMTADEAAAHCEAGIGIWEWASNDRPHAPDVVVAAAGDVPTLEATAAVHLLRQHVPDLRVRFVNVVDLMTLQTRAEHPHGLDDDAYDALFPPGTPVVFAFHGYPQLVHRLTYRRRNHADLHVHGFREEGTTTTPFDMVVINGLDRFHLAEAAVARVPRLAPVAAYARQMLRDKLAQHRAYVEREGEDMPEIRDWGWPYATAARAGD
jgi:xylulose-5-phosphate/fructose-6-phosphate phosphoketolase